MWFCRRLQRRRWNLYIVAGDCLLYEMGFLPGDAFVNRTRADLISGFVKVPPTLGGQGDVGPFGLDSWACFRDSDSVGLGWTY